MKSKRHAALAVPIGLGIAVLLAVLGVLRAWAPDDEAVRATLARELGRLEAWPATDPVGKDRRLEELLADEDGRKYARGLWTKLERLHGPAHQAARAQVAAARVVPDFLARCRTLEGLSPEELRALDEEARALLDEHGATGFAPGLKDARGRIAAKTASMAPACTDLDHFRILQEIQRERLAKHFRAALNRVQEAAAKHPRCANFLGKLRVARDEILNAPVPSLPGDQGPPDEERIPAMLGELKRP